MSQKVKGTGTASANSSNGGKGGGTRQTCSKAASNTVTLTEADLLRKKEAITPEDVLSLKAATVGEFSMRGGLIRNP